MRPHLFLLLLLAAAAAAPPASATCVPRRPRPPPANDIFSGAIAKLVAGAKAPASAPTPSPSPKPAPPPHPPVANGSHSGAPSPAGEAALVKKLCAASDCAELCESSIEEQPRPAGPFDAAAVLRMAMGAVRAKAAAARKAASELMCDPKTARLALGPLGDCVESYDDMAYSLDEAEKAMAAGDRDTMGTMLDTVRTDVDTCDQGFEERQELAPLMAKYDDLLAKLASNCLAVAAAGGLR